MSRHRLITKPSFRIRRSVPSAMSLMIRPSAHEASAPHVIVVTSPRRPHCSMGTMAAFPVMRRTRSRRSPPARAAMRAKRRQVCTRLLRTPTARAATIRIASATHRKRVVSDAMMKPTSTTPRTRSMGRAWDAILHIQSKDDISHHGNVLHVIEKPRAKQSSIWENSAPPATSRMISCSKGPRSEFAMTVISRVRAKRCAASRGRSGFSWSRLRIIRSAPTVTSRRITTRVERPNLVGLAIPSRSKP